MANKRGVKNTNYKHGLTGTRTYVSWNSMKQRCLNKNAPKYKNYGGRGIKVCSRWLGFENFFADMGKRPDGLSLDRINNDGNYEPDNCKWAIFKEQASNRRTGCVRSDNKTGVTGVCFNKQRNKYDVHFCGVYLGLFTLIKDAINRRLTAEKEGNHSNLRI